MECVSASTSPPWAESLSKTFDLVDPRHEQGRRSSRSRFLR
jgi:hypothetical protein